MKKVAINNGVLEVPQIAVGCMHMAEKTVEEAEILIQTALDMGINYFDHADIYGQGESEVVFAKAIGMTADMREKLFLQSKCGIRSGIAFDFSKEYILKSVDGILKRLETDYLDALLLHRPDALVEPEEVAEAFRVLKESGKVKYFGVSNHNAGQIALLSHYLDEPLLFNQLQFSLTNATMIESGMNVNMENEAAVNRDDGVLDYCRLHNITMQAWSPYQYGYFEGNFLGNEEKFPKLNECMRDMAEKYEVPVEAIPAAWIMRHPANMQVLVGTMNAVRLQKIVKAAQITLSREDWYKLYLSVGRILP